MKTYTIKVNKDGSKTTFKIDAKKFPQEFIDKFKTFTGIKKFNFTVEEAEEAIKNLPKDVLDIDYQ